MQEPRSAQMHEMNEMSLSDASLRFEHGDNMRDLYARMRPDQRTAIAGEFIRLLTLAGDAQVEQFRQHFQEHTQLVTEPGKTQSQSEELLSADEVARIDDYVRQKHPEMIAEVLRHPLTQSSLAMLGAPAVEEQDIPENQDKVMPTENVATSGAAYATSWMMMELGGEEANRLAEAPHEQAVAPDGEQEAVQRALENEGAEGERPSTEPTVQDD